MIQKFIFSVLFLFSIILKSYSQDYIRLNPSVIVGGAFRPNSIRLEDKKFYRYRFNFPYNIGSKAVYLSIDIKQNVYKEKIQIQLSNYLTYSTLSGTSNNPNSPIFANKNRIKRDHFLDLLYHFKSKNNKTLILGAGYGLMNCGTNFQTDLFLGRYDINGNPIQESNQKGYLRVGGPRLLVGFEKNKYSCFIISHGTPDPEMEQYATVWFEFKTSYTFNFFKNKPMKILNIFKN